MKLDGMTRDLISKMTRLRFGRNTVGRRLLWGGIILLVLAATVTSSVMPQRIQVKVGDVASRDIEAPKTIVNRLATEAKKVERVATVQEAYDLDLTAVDTIETRLTEVFNLVRTAQAEGGEAPDPSQLKNSLDFEVSDSVLVNILRLSPEQLNRLDASTKQIVRSLMQRGVKEEMVSEVRSQAASQVEALNVDRSQKNFAAPLVRSLIYANMEKNEAETNRRIQLAKDAVEQDAVKILKGQYVVRKGDIITNEHIAILEDLGLQRQQADYGRILGLGLFVLLLEVLIALYLRKFNPDIYVSEPYIVLIGLVVTLTLIICKILGGVSPYLAPVAAGALLIAILLDAKLAIVVNVVLSILTAVVLGSELRFMVISLIGGSAAVFSISRVNQRSDLTRSGVLIGVANVFAIFGLAAVAGVSLLEVLGESVLGTLGIANGLVAVVLANGVLPYLENNFGITTAVKLSELSNPSHPLLRRLLIETPGTYHHSIIVGNLAEAATEAVGGEPLLARTGAYYHDVGKIKRPYFFVENQISGGNPHDKVSPDLSTLMITSHIKDGVELAREYNLPPVIIDIIRQHHGTSLVKYFYQLAAGKDNSEMVAEEDFRYEGPKPQTREAAIVMLADSVEAAVRSLARPTQEHIEAMVRSILKDRLGDGQLDESALTFKDIGRIAATFIRVLQGIFHSRIEYPEIDKSETADRGEDNGNPDREPAR